MIGECNSLPKRPALLRYVLSALSVSPSAPHTELATAPAIAE